MKVEQTPADFLPVKITLESQDEIDKLFALFAHKVLIEALDIQDWFGELEKYKTQGYIKYFDIIDKLLK